MKYIMKIIICAVMIAVLISAMVFPTCASAIIRPETLSRSTAGLEIVDSSDTTRALPIKRPISGSENLVPTTEPVSGNTGSSTIHRPIRGEENLIPTTEPSSGSTDSGTIHRPIRGEENLIPTTEPSSGSTGSGTIHRPIPGEENLIPTTEPSSGSNSSNTPSRPLPGKENLIPTTPAPKPNAVITKPTTSDTASSGTSTTKPTESQQKPGASTSKSPYFTKHPTDETIREGANAQFVAIAENASGYNWVILSEDGNETYTIKEACSHFKGLKAEGSITTRLTLFYIPASLNGYYVACVAEGNGETVTSNGALLGVQSKNPPVQVKQNVPVTEAVTEPALAVETESTEWIETETILTETTQAEIEQMLQTTVPSATEENIENDQRTPHGMYLIAGVCIVLLVVAIILLFVLLKTLRRGKRR